MDKNLEWLQHRLEHYRSHENDMCEAIEDFDDLDQGNFVAMPYGPVFPWF